MGFERYVIGQFAKPSGILAPVVARLMNRGNRGLNAEALGALDVRPGNRVLEIGFGGGGSLPELLRRAAGGVVSGIDLSPEMCARAGAAFAAEVADGRLELVQGSAESLPWGDGSFDRVASVNSVMFWPDAAAGLREILRVLVPEGRCVLAVRTAAILGPTAGARFGVHLLSGEELERLYAEAGFQGVAVRSAADRRHGKAVIAFGRRPPAASVVLS